MKKIIGFPIIVAMVLVLATQAWALWEKEKTLQGSIKSIQAHLVTVVHKADDGLRIQEANFEVTDKTKFEKFVSLDNLKEGDRVKIQYKEEENKNVATTISKIEEEGVDINERI